MSTPVQCDQCRVILEEFRAAFYAGAQASPERNAELRAHSQAFLDMLNGSEEAAEALFAKFPFSAKRPEMLEPPEFLRSPGVRQAVQKMLEHYIRTGHVTLLTLPPDPDI